MADEWRDNICLRYNSSPLDMPATCDGCRAKMSFEHALSCKMGGLVHIQHDDVADEWRHLCGTAVYPSWVECKPRIFSSISWWARDAAGNTTPPPSSPPTFICSYCRANSATTHRHWGKGWCKLPWVLGTWLDYHIWYAYWDASCMLRYFLSGFQMGYEMDLSGCWPAANCNAVFSLVLSTYLCLLPAYLHTYLPSYIM